VITDGVSRYLIYDCNKIILLVYFMLSSCYRVIFEPTRGQKFWKRMYTQISFGMRCMVYPFEKKSKSY